MSTTRRGRPVIAPEAGTSGHSLWKANALVFTSNVCIMVVELVAGRILAPYVGVSLYTWTSIIGIVLAGISLGNYAGGKIADRYASRQVLGAAFLLSGLATLSILLSTRVVTGTGFLPSMFLMNRIIIYTALVFFIPTTIMGAITPIVVKMALRNLQETGQTVGTIYAYAALGSIVGTFVTGFYLIATFGTRNIIWMVAAVLILAGLIAGRYWENLRRAGLGLLIIAVVAGVFGLWRDQFKAPCMTESNYFCIRIDESTVQGRAVKALALDHLIHSYVIPEEPTYLGYEYEQIFGELSNYLAGEKKAPLDLLFIGGGGYTFPRALEVTHPDWGLSVVEIDPEVTRTAYNPLGLRPDTEVVTYNEDGRQYFLRNGNGGPKYDIIFGDAFNDLSVPYHLTTLEFSQLIKGQIKDNGMYVANIIDDMKDGEFLQAFMNTQAQVFKNVALVSIGGAYDVPGASTYVVVASDQPIDQARYQVAAAEGGRRSVVGRFVPQQTVDSFMNRGRRLVLTDDYNPVDNMVAPILARSK